MIVHQGLNDVENSEKHDQSLLDQQTTQGFS